MLPLCLWLSLLLPTAPEPTDWQKEADAAVWTWDDGDGSLYRSFTKYQGDYQVEIVKPAARFGTLTVRFTKEGKEVFAFEGHYASAFVVEGSVVYHTVYHPSATGCSVVAYDLAAGKQLWQTHLKGIGPIDHTRYRNFVAMDLAAPGVLRVRGNEAGGQYVEFVDGRTGKTVGHRNFSK